MALAAPLVLLLATASLWEKCKWMATSRPSYNDLLLSCRHSNIGQQSTAKSCDDCYQSSQVLSPRRTRKRQALWLLSSIWADPVAGSLSSNPEHGCYGHVGKNHNKADWLRNGTVQVPSAYSPTPSKTFCGHRIASGNFCLQ